MERIPKKVVFLHIIKIIKDNSSIEKPLNYTNIAKGLEKLGIKYDRKTVSRDIDMLSKTRIIAIEKVRGGCYYNKEKDTFFL